MFNRYIRPAGTLILVMTLILGLAFPAVVTAVGTALFRSKAQGSPLYSGDILVGSRLIGQSFSDPRYFWGRPSATSPMPYNGTASSGSNLGPLNPALLDAVTTTMKKLRDADPGNAKPVPVELVTASGSGLDPHLSPAAAEFQAARVAHARNLSLERVETLIREHQVTPLFGILGPPVVNVLELNLALDQLH